jgi:glyceraldehyde 3-phosphate dehydrogenase
MHRRCLNKMMNTGFLIVREIPMHNVAINGLGRIGRAVLKNIIGLHDINLRAVNDLAPIDNLAYLLRYDSVYGRFKGKIDVAADELQINEHMVQVLNQSSPEQLPWEELGVELVFECTGLFRHYKDLEKHLHAGAKRVVLSAPAKDADIPTVVAGVSELGSSAPAIVSTGSCTTNCVAPVAEVMARRIGVKKAIMTTTHAYTSSQDIVDSFSSKLERGRAGAVNLIPTTTGAATATIDVLPEYKGRFAGMAIRAPVTVGSIADITFVTERKTRVAEVNDIFREEAAGEHYADVLGVIEEPIVSSDIIMDPHASIVDLNRTQVVDGDLVKIMSWYDNEWGYAHQMVKQAAAMLKK